MLNVKEKGFEARRIYPLIAIALIVHMFYKVQLDKLTSGVFNAFLLITICVMFVLYFTKAYVEKRNKYVMISFLLYALYIVFLTVTDGEFTYVKRGVYEYGFYQAILFAAMFLVAKVNKRTFVKAIVFLGLPFVLAALFEVFFSDTSYIRSYTDNAIRITGWARSPLSLGMLSGIYSMFAFAQLRMSRCNWYWIPVFLGTFSMLVSGSRGPMVATFVALLVYLLIDVISVKGKKAIIPIGIFAAIVTILLVIFFTSDWELKNAEVNAMYIRLKKIVDWQGDAGNVGRLETWSKWFDVFLDNFWFGIGMSRMGSWSTGTIGVTESGLLRHLVELGFVGSVLYYNLIVSCFVGAIGALRRAKVKIDHFMLLNISIVTLVLVEDMVLQITEEITVAFFLWWSLGAMLGRAYECMKHNENLSDDLEKTKQGSKKKESISIVATTYNGEKFVLQQLESLLWQTRPADEVLIFDDCSSDKTPELVREFISKHNLTHWTFTVNEKNKGWKENFKDGLLAAKGDLVFPCDQDDIWRKDKLEICENIMKKRPNILVLASNYEEFGDCKQRIKPNHNNKELIQIPFEGNLFKIFYPGCSYCIRREFLKDIKKYWTPNSPHDATIWRYAMLRDGLYALNDNLLLWRVYKTSTFELELVNNRNKARKRQWLDYADGVLNDIDRYLTDFEKYRTKRNIQALKVNKKFLEDRKQFYDRSSVLCGFKMIKYMKYYAAPIQYVGDWLHVFRK